MGFTGCKHSGNFGCLIQRQIPVLDHPEELLEIPAAGISQGENSQSSKHREKRDLGIGGHGGRPFPLPTKKKKSQWEQGQLPWKKTTKKEGTSGRSEDFEAFPVPSLPSINPKENPTLFFLLYGFVLQEGGEENSNPHSQKFPLWDLFPLGKSLKNSSCAPSPIQLLPQCPTPGNFSQAPSFQFPLVQHTQILL